MAGHLSTQKEFYSLLTAHVHALAELHKQSKGKNKNITPKVVLAKEEGLDKKKICLCRQDPDRKEE